MPPLILVVDDNPEVTQVVSAILRRKQYETMTATSGQEALALMEKRRPDLILCDIMMPDMDGYEVFQRVRADRRWRTIPFAFVTALSDPETRALSSEMGAEAFIAKPFQPQELLAVVAGMLRRAEELQSYTEAELESFKSQLLFMITHELNTPLSVIRMLVESMRSNLARLSPERLAEYLDLLARSTGELSYIVESMLLAIQIDSGRAQALYKAWAAPQLVQTVLETVLIKAAPQAAERHVSVVRRGFGEAAWVRGHEEQLRQIFSRVLDNAIRFSPRGGTVEVHLAANGQQVRVTFSDQGPGMSPDEVEAAFDRLRQINRAQQEQQGVGLSLSMVRSLVHIHGGEITMRSTPGQGTSVTITLPRIPAPVKP
jgi:signal transduction histidine kinase